jgi:hypothetical protein
MEASTDRDGIYSVEPEQEFGETCTLLAAAPIAFGRTIPRHNFASDIAGLGS